MKTLIISLLSLTLLNTHLFADDGEINTDTARAYEAHLVTFMWPEGQSSEQINYKNVLSTGNLLRLTKDEEGKPSAASNTSEVTPFGNIEGRLGKHVKILANQQWMLIFNHPGDTISKTFHSEQEKDGYPELTGSISVKLGRYLESDIRYQHYLFDSFTQPNTQGQSGKGSFFSQGRNTLDTQPDFKEFDPALVLALNQRNKTASKKVNYLDHPTIGTLLYFEPIELEDAMDKIALLSMMPETGKSLNYDELQSTNELSLK